MKLTFLLSVCLLLLAFAIEATDGASHYCRTKYSVRVTKYKRISYNCGYYDGWGWWRRYHGRTCYSSSAYNSNEIRTNYHTCCPGWKGSRCDIPICDPVCRNNAICYDRNRCYCSSGTSGAQCSITTCSALTDCYPGTCFAGNCYCTSGFAGGNCEKILDGPEFKRCSVNLIDNVGDSAFTSKCGAPGQPEMYTYYSNKRDISSIEIDMETVYVYPGEIPYKPSYMPSSAVGNVASYARASLRRKDGTLVKEQVLICDPRVDKSHPFAAADCRNESYAWKHAIGNEYRLEINMYGESGGYKNIFNPVRHRIEKRFYTGIKNNQTVLIIFDIEAPTHCHEDLSDNCTAAMPPVLSLERVVSPNITIECEGWKDGGTGLLSYTYQVYKMGLNSLDQFEHSGEPIFTQKIDLLGLTSPLVNYTLPGPGRYSAVLTVTDRAGNTKKARSLILFDDSNKIAIRPNKTITLQNAVKGTDHLWLTNFTKGGPTVMTAMFEGVFHNPYHIEHSLLNEAEAFSSEWGYEDTFGNLTTSRIFNFDGITGFDFAYGVDQIGGQSVLNNPPTFEPVVPLKVTQSFSHIILDRYTVVLMVRAYDAVGNNITQTVNIHVDSTPPVVLGAIFTKDVNATDQEETPYASRLGVQAHDAEGGIGEVEYEIRTSAENKQIGKGILRNFKLSKVNAATCKLPNSGCICTEFLECFPTVLPVAINNCLFMNNLQDKLLIKYSVKNLALLETKGPEDVEIGPLATVNGLHHYPGAEKFQAVNISDEHVDLLWTYPKSCYTPSGAIVTFGNSLHNVAYPKNSYTIKDLDPEKQHTFGLIIKYDDQNSATKPLAVITKPKPCLGRGCNQPGLGAGGIVGIVIAMLLIVAITVMLVMIVLRRRANKPAIPEPLRHMGNTIRNRFSSHPGGDVSRPNNYVTQDISCQENAAYLGQAPKQTEPALMVSCIPGLQGTEEDIYIYGDMETDANATWKHTGDQVVPGAIISAGRFAEVRKATLNSKQTVVAKMLKVGATNEDRLLMKAKMNFLATSVPTHVNLVKLVGAVPSDSPVILLEYCDQTLKDWLKSQDKVTEEVEDNMINFSTHVARAVAHLSENHIVHRRLGIRNILLTKVNGSLIAKVTGFGPMKTEVEGTNTDKERIPMKWMAPEQIGGPKGQKRIYNEKTDMWSYGITVWEIFTKGGSPYKDYKHGDLPDLHQSGYRLPKPDYAPREMYENVMLKCWANEHQDRPTFGQMVSFLDSHFHGGAGDEYYYEDTAKDMASGKNNAQGFPNNLYEI